MNTTAVTNGAASTHAPAERRCTRCGATPVPATRGTPAHPKLSGLCQKCRGAWYQADRYGRPFSFTALAAEPTAPPQKKASPAPPATTPGQESARRGQIPADAPAPPTPRHDALAQLAGLGAALEQLVAENDRLRRENAALAADRALVELLGREHLEALGARLRPASPPPPTPKEASGEEE